MGNKNKTLTENEFDLLSEIFGNEWLLEKIRNECNEEGNVIINELLSKLGIEQDDLKLSEY